MQSKVVKQMALGLGLALLGSQAVADDTFYSGIQLQHLSVERDGISRSELLGVGLRAGVALTDWFALEARLGKAFGSTTERGIKAENEFYHAQLVRLTAPTTTRVNPYVLGGYGYIENRFNDQRVRDDGLATGFGFDYAVDDNIAVGLEYFRVVDNDRSKHFLISLGMNYRF